MGLDITAYRGLTEARGNEAFDETGELRYDEGWVQLYMNPDFPGRADELTDRRAYKFEEEMGFRAGSYGGYSVWREQLAALAEYPKASAAHFDGMSKVYAESSPHSMAPLDDAYSDETLDALPFIELVEFSDCEGVIGTAVSAKLAGDFARFQEKADAHPNEYFRAKYAEWRKAFEFASDRGAVVFH